MIPQLWICTSGPHSSLDAEFRGENFRMGLGSVWKMVTSFELFVLIVTCSSRKVGSSSDMSTILALVSFASFLIASISVKLGSVSSSYIIVGVSILGNVIVMGVDVVFAIVNTSIFVSHGGVWTFPPVIITVISSVLFSVRGVVRLIVGESISLCIVMVFVVIESTC